MHTQKRADIQHLDLADRVLIERTLAGDQRAFEALMHRYRAPLFQAVYHS